MSFSIVLQCIFLAIGGMFVSGLTHAMPFAPVQEVEPTGGPIQKPALVDTLPAQTSEALPVLGYGVGAFSVDDEIFQTDFSEASEWAIQVEQKDEPLKERIKFDNGMLDLYMPARGCTAWLKRKFKGPIMISYQVKCPLETIRFPEIQARDINNFWHCSGSESHVDLFDAKIFDGGFGSYSKMKGWYASTGGGGRVGNRTTRFRRYPREVDGKPCPHIALKDRDGEKKFLITPGKWHTIQLVACEDLAQYIVDGVVVYQIQSGDSVDVEVPANESGGDRTVEKRIYQPDKFPPLTEGYFGFRMVRSHHQYKNLSVHRLKPVGDSIE